MENKNFNQNEENSSKERSNSNEENKNKDNSVSQIAGTTDRAEVNIPTKSGGTSNIDQELEK